MDAVTRVAYDAQRNFDEKPFRSACYAPFVSMYFTSLGDVLTCCKSYTYSLGNVSTQRLGEIWNGRKIRDMRTGLRDYHFEGGCEFCEAQFAGGSFDSVFAAGFERYAVTSEEPEWPRVIEFAGSNNCNFECIMCDGLLSSSIRAHREGLPPLPKFYSDEFFQDLRPFLGHLQHAKFLGGEPFLAPECFRIWDMILEDGLVIPCHVTTNASQYTPKVERVLEALPVSLSISMDGATRETFEKIRINSDYDAIIRNIHRFRVYTRQQGTWMGIAHCLMRPNWHEFGELLMLAESLVCPLFVNTVLTPAHSLYTLPPEDLNRIVDEMELQGNHFKDKLLINRQVWEDQIRNLRSAARGHQLGELAQIKTAARRAETDDQLRPAYSLEAAWALVRAGREQEALAEALALTPSHPVYYQSLILCAHIRRMHGDLDQAEADINRAVQLSHRPLDALLERAWLRLAQRRPAEGAEDALAVLELCQQNGLPDTSAWSVLAYLYTQARNFADAMPVLDRLLERAPADPEVRVQRAWAFEEFGRREDAIREVEAALALDPKHPDAISCSDYLSSEEPTAFAGSETSGTMPETGPRSSKVALPSRVAPG